MKPAPSPHSPASPVQRDWVSFGLALTAATCFAWNIFESDKAVRLAVGLLGASLMIAMVVRTVRRLQAR